MCLKDIKERNNLNDRTESQFVQFWKNMTMKSTYMKCSTVVNSRIFGKQDLRDDIFSSSNNRFQNDLIEIQLLIFLLELILACYKIMFFLLNLLKKLFHFGIASKLSKSVQLVIKICVICSNVSATTTFQQRQFSGWTRHLTRFVEINFRDKNFKRCGWKLPITELLSVFQR